MADEKAQGSKLGISAEAAIKWIGIALLILGYAFYFGRRDDKTDLVVSQNAALDTKIESTKKQLQALSDRVLILEVTKDANQRYVDQDKAYRDQLKK